MRIEVEVVWVSVDERLPKEEGTYTCKIVNGENKKKEKRLLKLRNGRGYWFGGCRPFADHDVITHWLEVAGK